MEEINVIKKRMNQINHKVFNEGKTILECLNELQIDLRELLVLLGLDGIYASPYLEEIIEEVTKVVESKGAYFSYNPAMKRINDDEIDIYDQNTNRNIGIFNNEISSIYSHKFTGDIIETERVLYKSYKLNRISKKCAFEYYVAYKKEEASKSPVTQNYVLQVAEMQAYSETYKDGEVVPKAFRVKIPVGITMGDFQKYLRPLYTSSLEASHDLFMNSLIPTMYMQDNYYLENMHKEVNRFTK